MVRFFLILILTLPAWANNTKPVFNLEEQVAKYKNIKHTNNHGDGNDNLYGTRNFKVVLHGVYYRGGANNKYNKHLKRDNQNPLPEEGLNNLCKQGFSEAMYFYEQNYKDSKKSVSCNNGELKYLQISSLKSGNEKAVLEQVYKHIKGEIPGPIYGHCWNGWHASGYAAAISLMQFCKWDNKKALTYWRKNTDGHDTKEYQHVMDKIKKFAPFADLKISDNEAKLICPN